MRRGWLTLGLGLLVSAPGLAQDAGTEVTSLSLPLALRGQIETASEHGCSQSFASTTRRAELSLALDARGGATFVSEVRAYDHSGPSPGAYGDGAREFSVIQEHTRTTLTGRAASEGGSLVITFDRARTETARWSGEGTLPLGPATEVAAQFVLRCAMARAEVLPARWAEGERASPLSLLACTFEAAPASLAATEVPTFHLGRGRGARTVREARMWDADPTAVVRRAE